MASRTTAAATVSAHCTTRRAVTAGALMYVRLFRCRQWIKNAFVFGALIFAGELFQRASVLRSLAAFAGVSLLTSGGYIFNDWLDRDRDLLHPEKCSRPLASGAVPGSTAALLGGAALVCGLGMIYVLLPLRVVWLALAYIALSAGYSLWLKNEVILDVFVIAAGFILRVWIGACAIAAPASHWLILCTFFLALFLGFCKRENEIALLNSASAGHRLVLASYTAHFISEMVLVAVTASLLCYGLYTVSADTVAKFGTDRLVYTVPIVAYGLFRYLFLVRVKGKGGNPGDLLFRDSALSLSIFIWLACCVFLIYT